MAKRICKKCNKNIGFSDGSAVRKRGHWYCKECVEDIFAKCSHCNATFKKDILTEYKGKSYCNSCITSEFIVCKHCDAIESADLNLSDLGWIQLRDYSYMCSDCAEKSFRCNCCGELVGIDDGTEINDKHYCRECYYTNFAEPIKNYSYVPDHIKHFKTEDDSPLAILYGVELEIACRGDASSVAIIVINELYNSGFEKNSFCIKHDGSIPNGFEIVFQPMTYKYYHTLRFKDFFNAISSDSNIFSTRECGMHVHISNANEDVYESLKLTKNERLAMLYFFSEHSDWLYEASGRTVRTWFDEYSEFQSYSYELLCNGFMPAVKRHSAFNPSTRHGTSEVRIFSSTKNYNTFMFKVELVDAIVQYIKTHRTIQNGYNPITDFENWVVAANEYSNVTEYINSKS